MIVLRNTHIRFQEHMDKSNKSAINWKCKAISRSTELKRLNQNLRRSRASAVRWRSRFMELRESNQATRVANHSYGIEVMWLAVLMRISFNASLRSISGTLKMVSEWRGYRYKAISASTIRNWCLRVGFYCLQKPIRAGTYVIIVDESIGINKEKVLVIMAVAIGEASPIQPLRISDAEVWAVQSKSSWDGAAIAALIEAKQNEPGVHIAYAVSDGGSNIRNGIRRSQIKSVMDCTHALANCSKRLFTKDETFNTFIKQMNMLRAKWVLSKHSQYLPPALRSKSRFHQLFTISKWANSILAIWEQLPQEAQQNLCFVTQNRTLVSTMTKLHELIEQFASIFKTAGIQSIGLQQWQVVCDQWRQESAQTAASHDPRIDRFIATMNQYLEDQKQTLPDTCQILCCSDIIESAFGKYKNKSGAKTISDDILQIAAYSKELPQKEIQNALCSISCSDLKNWKRNYTVHPQLSLNKIVKAKMVTQSQ